MLIFLAILIALVLIVFGVAFAADAIAHAKEAQATIEVARVAQVQSVNNLITVLVLSVLVLVLALIIVGMIVLAVRYMGSRDQEQKKRQSRITPVAPQAVITRVPHQSLPTPHHEQIIEESTYLPQADDDDLFNADLLSWLE